MKTKAATTWVEGRVLHFVRHGQYVMTEGGKPALTSLGQRQARFIARHFRNLRVDRIYASDMLRARETANILAKELDMSVARRYRLLREVLPARVPGMKIPLAKRKEGAQRVEQILKQFFRPSTTTCNEIVVCHGNLIRSLVLRLASGSANGFDRLMIHHGSVTSFVVTNRGARVLGFNSLVHMPLQLRTMQ